MIVDWLFTLVAMFLAAPSAAHVMYLINGRLRFYKFGGRAYLGNWYRRLYFWWGLTIYNEAGFVVQYTNDPEGTHGKLGGLADWDWSWTPAHGTSHRAVQQNREGPERRLTTYDYIRTERQPSQYLLQFPNNAEFGYYLRVEEERAVHVAWCPQTGEVNRVDVERNVPLPMFFAKAFSHWNNGEFYGSVGGVECYMRYADRDEIPDIAFNDE